MGEGFYVGRVEGEPTCPRGKRAKCQHSVLSGEAGNEVSLLARNERRMRFKHERRRLSERYRIPPVCSIYIQPPWSGVCTCFALTNLGRFRLQRLSASSIVATPHWGDCSFSDDLRIDEISATGGHRFFAPAGETLPSFARSAKECLSQWTGILTMFHI